MERFARIVLGYHGCRPEFAEALIRGDISIDDWVESNNPYDWLGTGIYFWEHAPARAKSWTTAGGVVGAVLELGRCLDFTDVRYTELLPDQYEALRESFANDGVSLPQNKGKRRELDCLVINKLLQVAESVGEAFQTVRSAFLEGTAAFPGSAILRESHIQIAVRDRSCILGVFRPNPTQWE